MIYLEKMLKANQDKQVKVSVKPSCFVPEFEMTIKIPYDKDSEEYIEEYLNCILDEEFKYNFEWEFR